MLNIYEHCPVYETESFVLRLVTLEDAEALLKCYSDKDMVLKMNSDYCTSDFFYTTKEEMEQCIKFWLEEYEKQYYVRFAVIPKSENNIIEIVMLVIHTFSGDFGIRSIKIKTANTPGRIKWLEALGFVVSKNFRPELGYHEFDISNE